VTRRLVLVAALGAAWTGSAYASASFQNFPITGVSIERAKLGGSVTFYERFFGKPFIEENLESGFRRVTFTKRAVAVYFHANSRAIAIVTWHRGDATGAGVGPCRPSAQLHAAYGSRLRPLRLGGRVVGYRFGTLSFGIQARLISAVMLAQPSVPSFILSNSPACP
jgi:hypothetical protein